MLKYVNAPVEGKVGVVTGGGSGHKPAFIGYIGKNKYILMTLLGIMLAVTVVDLLGPFFQQKAIDTITLDEDTLAIDFKKLTFYLKNVRQPAPLIF